MLRKPAVLLLAFLWVPDGAFAQDAAAKELELLQGNWTCKGTDYEKRKDPANDRIRMSIDGNKLVVTLGKLTTTEGTLGIDPTAKPKAIDLKCSDGRIVLGVYELDGNRLRITFSDPGEKRPVGIDPKGSQWRANWERVKP